MTILLNKHQGCHRNSWNWNPTSRGLEAGKTFGRLSPTPALGPEPAGQPLQPQPHHRLQHGKGSWGDPVTLKIGFSAPPSAAECGNPPQLGQASKGGKPGSQTCRSRPQLAYPARLCSHWLQPNSSVNFTPVSFLPRHQGHGKDSA